MVISCLILGKIFNPKIYQNQCYNRSILGKNYNWTHQMFSIKIMLRYQLLPFENCRHWADFIILEMLWWRFWKRQSGEFCIGCNWIPCFCIRYRNAAITEHGSLSRDAMFCSSRIVHPYRRNQPWFQVYTSVCPRGARREKAKGDGFLLFLKAFSWEADLLVTLGDFTVKKRKIGKGNLYLSENWSNWNEICYAADNQYCVTHVEKNF